MNQKFIAREILFLPKLMLVSIVITAIKLLIEYKDHNFLLGLSLYDDEERLFRDRFYSFYKKEIPIVFFEILAVLICLRLIYLAFLWAKKNK